MRGNGLQRAALVGTSRLLAGPPTRRMRAPATATAPCRVGAAAQPRTEGLPVEHRGGEMWWRGRSAAERVMFAWLATHLRRCGTGPMCGRHQLLSVAHLSDAPQRRLIPRPRRPIRGRRPPLRGPLWRWARRLRWQACYKTAMWAQRGAAPRPPLVTGARRARQGPTARHRRRSAARGDQ